MSNLRPGHAVRLLFTGEEFFPALIDAVDGAKREVRLETYIFHTDAVGDRVLDALARAAERGVSVYLVVDGVGTPHLPDAWTQRLNSSGVQWHQFMPLGSIGLLFPEHWRRLHRKLCVVDGQTAFCGGINVLDDYMELEQGPQTTPRFDFAVQVKGPLVADTLAAMEQFWLRLQITRGVEQGRFRQVRRALSQRKVQLPQPERQGLPVAGVLAGLLLRDNVRNRTRIERAYRQAIAHAKVEVVIANAYFLPGAKLRRSLMHAVQRGVKVRLLLQGRYEFFMQHHASKPFYAALLQAGIEIYEYQAGYLHAKVAVVDGQWATVGSSNLDPLSLLLAREANVVVEDAGFANELLNRIHTAIVQHSVQMDEQHLSNRPAWLRLKDTLAYTLMRLTLFLTGKKY
jgi:cardiolipin synthase